MVWFLFLKCSIRDWFNASLVSFVGLLAVKNSRWNAFSFSIPTLSASAVDETALSSIRAKTISRMASLALVNCVTNFQAVGNGHVLANLIRLKHEILRALSARIGITALRAPSWTFNAVVVDKVVDTAKGAVS
eukprot:TRINITY_DN2029_c0_g1_i1.p2 TRINITY_DN2029_c0_g1~~TRINITY_DN2029_c0_g1_i1.p2  ORF type:complete len:133 (-),score=16.43 TRINITY_DN2029_c0_g1_i1:432-830(-)